MLDAGDPVQRPVDSFLPTPFGILLFPRFGLLGGGFVSRGFACDGTDEGDPGFLTNLDIFVAAVSGVSEELFGLQAVVGLGFEHGDEGGVITLRGTLLDTGHEGLLVGFGLTIAEDTPFGGGVALDQFVREGQQFAWQNVFRPQGRNGLPVLNAPFSPLSALSALAKAIQSSFMNPTSALL